jgi:hypothetical protein
MPGSDAASQDGLNGTAVNPFEDLRPHAKTFSTSWGGRGAVTPSGLCACVWTIVSLYWFGHWGMRVVSSLLLFQVQWSSSTPNSTHFLCWSPGQKHPIQLTKGLMMSWQVESGVLVRGHKNMYCWEYSKTGVGNQWTRLLISPMVVWHVGQWLSTQLNA